MLRSSSLARVLPNTIKFAQRQAIRRYHPALSSGVPRYPSYVNNFRHERLKLLYTAKFSSAPLRWSPSGTVDEELVAKIDSEISMEKQLEETEDMPTQIKEFLEGSQFTLNDKDGHEEVELVRKFGNETIRVLFSVSDVEGMDDKLEDSALYDEDIVNANEESTTESAKPPVLRNDRGAQAEVDVEDEDYDDEAEPAYPVRLNVTIEKPNQGALQIETVAQDGMILIENVHYHESAQLATAQTAEADYERRGRYVGPPFGNLDEELQMLLEKYLDERGVNTSLALFVPDYIDYKEQKEYLRWLENMKNFVAQQ